MALPAPLQALFDRLQTYNSDPYNSTSNPGGFARGGNQKPVDNFIKSIRDFTAFGRGISDNVDGSVDAAAASASAAAANVLLTAEDAENTRLDRIATAENVVKAAGEVTKAAGQVALASGQADRARGEADRAANLANTVDGPVLRRRPYALNLHFGS